MSLSSALPAATDGASDVLALDVGGDHVLLRNGRIEIRDIGGFGPNQGQVLRSQTLTPTPAQWTELWATLEKLGVWEWQTVYRSKRSSEMDGVRWSLKLAHAGRSLTAGGYNAFPDAWPAFQAALQKLTAHPAAAPRR
jgi:hypothetical protein